MALCTGLTAGVLAPTPISVYAATGFELTASELSARGVPVVPAVLADDNTFMNQFVSRGSSLNINSSFTRYRYKNVSGASDTLPTGTLSRNKSDNWYAQYKWTPNTAEKAALDGDLVLVFESNVTPDYHTHNYVFSKTSHWSTSGVRINSGDWTYGENDYGYRSNGNRLFSAASGTVNDGQAQKVTKSWSGNPILESDGYLSFSAYSSWANNCGDPKVSGSVFYFKDTSYPTVKDVDFSTGNYVSLLGKDVTGTVTLTFSEPIRFADNVGTTTLQLELDAYYGDQSGRQADSDYPLYANLTSLEGNQMVFTFTVPQSAKHIYIKGLTREQNVQSGYVSLLDQRSLYLYDKNGVKISNTNLTSTRQITDLAGNHMIWYGYETDKMVFDGVQPTLKNVVMSGKDITAVSSEPAKDWNANSGNNRYVYAGVGDKISFQAIFSENINLSGDSKAVLSIEDATGNPVKLGVKSVHGGTVTFEELEIAEGMKLSGEQIVISAFEDMTVKDYCGNITSSTLNPNGLKPAQEITLDPDCPTISTTLVADGNQVYAPLADAEGEYFTVPIKFMEDIAKTSAYSDISGIDASFTLEMLDGDTYSYWWYIDSNQTVDKSVFYRYFDGASKATTGTTAQTLTDISHDHQYFLHFRLDPNVDYNYTSQGGNDENGIYFQAKLTAQVSDWAGNAAQPFSIDLKHSVDTDAPEISFAQSLRREPGSEPGVVNFCADFLAADEYAIRKVWYDGALTFGDNTTLAIAPVTLYEDTTTDSFSREETDSVSYSYSYKDKEEAKQQGYATVNLYVEDYTGKTHTVSQSIYFNYVKARNRSYINDMGTELTPVSLARLTESAQSMQVVTMQAPDEVSGSTAVNPARTLMLIPNITTKNGEGKYTNFWMFDPWDWEPLLADDGTVAIKPRMEYPTQISGGNQPGDPIANAFLYMDGYDKNYTPESGYHSVVSGIPGRYYYMTGTVDPENHTGSFTDCDILDAAGSISELRDYLRDYYGVLDIYFVTTTSIAQFEYTGWATDGNGMVTGTWPKASDWNFDEPSSTVDAYQIYLADSVTYGVETLAITDAAGADAKAVLDYQDGNVPAKSLDNVSLSFRITNESDAGSNFAYGQNLLRFSQYNPAVQLYYTGSSRTDNGGTLTIEWSLEESSDGIYTVSIAEDTCTKNGWYRMDVRLADWMTGEYTTYHVGYFFMDSTVVGLKADSYYKEYDHEGLLIDAVAADFRDLESMASQGKEIVLGLDEADEEEGWSILQHYLRFTTQARPEEDALRRYYSNDMVQIRVHNHTYDAAAGLTGETGLWVDSTTKEATSHDYLPYLAAAGQENPYGTTEVLKLPFVEGYNLLVYEIKNTNGEIVTKEILVNVYGEAEEWVLDYETVSENGVDINSVTVRPLLAALDETTGTMIYEPAPDDARFSFLDGNYSYYTNSYTFTDDLCSVFYLIDGQGNLSTNHLELRDANGELLDIDGEAPYYVGINDLDSDEYGTFHFRVYAYDFDSTMLVKDMKLLFDPVYSTVLKGEMDDQGRVVMPIPLALDEDGKLKMVDTDGDGTPDEYATWESKDTIYNGIYRTKVLKEGLYQYADEEPTGGFVDVEVWGVIKYDQTLVDYLNENSDYNTGIYVSAADAYGNVKESALKTFGVPYGYSFETYTLDEDGEVNGDLGSLNAEGELGLVSEIPFVAINGYGAGEQIETIYHYYGYKQYYTTAPMIVEDGTYTFQVLDYFGESHDVEVTVDAFGELGIDVTFSETEQTNQDVTITARAIGEYDEIISIKTDDGQEGTIDPMDPSYASITVSENCSVTIATEDGKTRTIPVANIDKTLDPVRIIYYDQNYEEVDPTIGAETVTAVLVCDTETVLTTNGPDTYRFPAGSEMGTTYTFEYEDLAGNAGSITATLGVTLPEPTEVDSLAPVVSVNLYASLQQRYHYLEEIFAPDDGTPITETLGVVRAQGYKLILSIADDSDVKVIVQPNGSAAPTDYATATSGSNVAGVTCVTAGKKATLEITENTIFDLYVMDEENNLTSIIGISVGALDQKAPELNARYTTETDEDGYAVVTATFYPTEDSEALEVITPLSEGVLSKTEQITVSAQDPEDPAATTTVDVIRYYHIFSANGDYSFTYQDELGNIGTASARVKGLSTDAAKVNQVNWYGTRTGIYGNVTPDNSDMVSNEITAQLRMNKPISQVELFEYNENMTDGIGAVFENDAVRVNATATTIDVIYSANVYTPIVVRFRASASGRMGTYVLPVVECIDRKAPEVTLEKVQLAENHRSVTLTFTTDEEALLSKELGAGYGTTHTLTLKDSKPVTLYFTDKAGNQVTYQVTENADVDTEDLTVSYSAASDGVGTTTDPVKDLTIDVGGTLYVKVTKEAKAVIGERDYGTLPANTWTAISLPEKGGLHILTLTDTNTGDVVQQLIAALPKDNIAPVITLATDTILVHENDTIERMNAAVHTGVTVTDNEDDHVDYTVTGIPAAMESGLYSLCYTAQDQAGNQISVFRNLYIMAEGTPILWINDEVGVPYGKVFVEGGQELKLTMENMEEMGDTFVIKYRKGIYTTGQMKYYATTIEDMSMTLTEPGHYTIYVRSQDRIEFVTYIYVEG